MRVLIARIRLLGCPGGDEELVALVSPELERELGNGEPYNAFITAVDAPVLATEADAVVYARDKARELGCRDTRVRLAKPSRSTVLRLTQLLRETKKGRDPDELAREFRSLAVAISHTRVR